MLLLAGSLSARPTSRRVIRHVLAEGIPGMQVDPALLSATDQIR
jgi:hypothetical protein